MRATLDEQQQSSRVFALALASVVTSSSLIVTIGVARIALTDARHAPLAVAATVAYLPFHLAHVRRAAHGSRPRSAPWTLAAMAVVIGAVLPVVGIQWVTSLYPLAASVLLVLRRPWAVPFFVLLVVTPVPVAYLAGVPSWAVFFGVWVLLNGILLAVPVWLMAATRELRAGRALLADEAVARERLRIDGELRATLGTALDTIVATGEQAGALVDTDPDEAADRLRVVVGAARTTLGDARRMVAGFQRTPLLAELDTAVTLLRATGIDARLVPPVDAFPEHVREPLLADLRAEVARLLQADSVRHCVITVTCRPGGVDVELRSDEAGQQVRRVIAA
ncbi:hypothetical protein F0L68_00775 [Solihabitans fulvus]|uniref:Signal transduction histidine kinase n=1 Tax=Solihabitans fulvus TaxID=1892852 RepID=A0A5B2XW83_9PSEU|nr:histidine kinase [Solihabitans fulvus]KAA2267099.1 hypothetical protein F0L68_00775 [Solihabitans fulvus]